MCTQVVVLKNGVETECFTIAELRDALKTLREPVKLVMEMGHQLPDHLCLCTVNVPETVERTGLYMKKLPDTTVIVQAEAFGDPA